MTDFDRGPLYPYEVTWTSGYIETIWAHQVTFPDDMRSSPIWGGLMATKADFEPTVRFHGEVHGHWLLLLEARRADIVAIRNKVTEVSPGGGND